MGGGAVHYRYEVPLLHSTSRHRIAGGIHLSICPPTRLPDHPSSRFPIIDLSCELYTSQPAMGCQPAVLVLVLVSVSVSVSVLVHACLCLYVSFYLLLVGDLYLPLPCSRRGGTFKGALPTPTTCTASTKQTTNQQTNLHQPKRNPGISNPTQSQMKPDPRSIFTYN